MASTVVYAYAVARAAEGLPDRLTGLRGVAGTRVSLLHGATPEVVAATSRVPAADFQEDALARHLEDLDWLEQVARAHHEVVAALSAATTVLPLRLATVYLDEDRLRDVLDARRRVFTDRLARLDAHVEWGIKLYVDASAEPARHPPAADAALSPGRAYLKSRRTQRDRRADAYRAAEQAEERIEAAARGLAVERARHRVQQGELAGGDGENVVNDAYLVPESRSEAFRRSVLTAADGLPGVHVEVTGPWAPYSFATPPDDGG
ncbi:GvpL/GvpF family gas vesicle protein [Kitasatospora sp. NBC_00240]|uniref:GvpL/GvpF family gas vesicle protein n=1 Tax=Kitasatospora sp. NBC_00240 TaxID=2903567 RepID=UPI0022501519|nr:GvpL/GvpF family gas vesicle protein [Kitasatospora sp. NBC_00240]MCX5215258.1 GvpL/GvpF family gas vesicle protein [Kitasatospora sp. NBC_00240]